MNKTIKITAVIIAVIILIAFVFFIWTYIKIKNGDLVKWDNKWYTKEELKKAFPPQYIEVPAKNTPEQVYTIFRQALLDNDIEKALEQIREKNREEYRKIFFDYQNKDASLINLGKVYPENITKDHEYGNFAAYNFIFYKDNKKIDSSINFQKNSEGYWQIDNI
ncbi:hypothetical protein KKF94_00420 [Patescibacteria group bacterium]|nr:hypothetical protein [Patescibacteria group bacterium]